MSKAKMFYAKRLQLASSTLKNYNEVALKKRHAL